MTPGLSYSPRRLRRRRQLGQSLAEFALVFPFFIVLLFGVVEFSFAFNGALSIDFATRDAALAAAEAGSETGADCSILRVIEKSITAPADRTKITKVRIFKATTLGANTGLNNTFTRGTGTYTCPDGTGTLPYKKDPTSNYAEGSRCNILAGCGGSSTTVDTVGVELTYVYTWKTPLPRLLPLSGTGYTMVKDNAMRMEPVL